MNTNFNSPPRYSRFIVAAAIGAGAALLGGALSGILGSSSANKSFNRQKQLMDYQNNINVSNWNMMNSYNSPLNQRSRLAHAGVNPAMVGVDGNIASAVPEVGIPSPPQSDNLSEVIPNAIQSAAQASTSRLQQSQSEKNKAETQLTDAMREQEFEAGGVKFEWYKGQTKLSDKQREKLSAEILKLDQDTQVEWERVKQQWYSIGIQEQQAFVDQWFKEQQVALQGDANANQKLAVVAQLIQAYTGLKVSDSIIASNYASANASNANARLANANADSIALDNWVKQTNYESYAGSQVAKWRSESALSWIKVEQAEQELAGKKLENKMRELDIKDKNLKMGNDFYDLYKPIGVGEYNLGNIMQAGHGLIRGFFGDVGAGLLIPFK